MTEIETVSDSYFKADDATIDRYISEYHAGYLLGQLAREVKELRALSRRSLDAADGVGETRTFINAVQLVEDAGWVVLRPEQVASRTRNTEVGVKALEWGGVDVNGERHAKSVFGTYTIRGWQGSMGFWLTQVGGYHQTVEAAKAAAQSDFDQRIRSALASPPSPAEVTVTDEMVFAAMAKADELGEPLEDIDARLILTAALDQHGKEG